MFTVKISKNLKVGGPQIRTSALSAARWTLYYGTNLLGKGQRLTVVKTQPNLDFAYHKLICTSQASDPVQMMISRSENFISEPPKRKLRDKHTVRTGNFHEISPYSVSRHITLSSVDHKKWVRLIAISGWNSYLQHKCVITTAHYHKWLTVPFSFQPTHTRMPTFLNITTFLTKNQNCT
jgi:hypothetical protein